MNGKIYLLSGDDELMAFSEVEYESERLLQALIAKHPDLLAVGQIDSVGPRAGRWSVDHLFLDQDGIPTLVEVKRRWPDITGR